MISIAMCTYNGEQFLLEQLKSFVHQSILPNELVIFDDASSDNTLAILREFAQEAPFIVHIHRNKQSVGVQKNFELAIEACKGEYIFFSDQDDVWLPNKIEITLNKMQSLELANCRELPICIHTDLYVVDAELNILANSYLKNQGLYHVYSPEEQLEVLPVQNFVTGCTVLINKALKNIAMPFPKNIVMHDYWFALVAACVGKLEFVDAATIKYRQHGNNTIGARKYLSVETIISILDEDRILNRINKTYSQMLELINFKNGMCIQNHPKLLLFRDYIEQGNIKNICQLGFHKEHFLRNLVYRIYLKKFAKSLSSK